jgi:hypothetical protein
MIGRRQVPQVPFQVGLHISIEPSGPEGDILRQRRHGIPPRKHRRRKGPARLHGGFVQRSENLLHRPAFEQDIQGVVRGQIEEEIYDLFLWKKAEFEFLIDYIPEKLKNPAHGITKLQFNTNSLIMEALRRLDEWGVISQEISTLKEVYKIVNQSSSALDEIDLPDRVHGRVDRRGDIAR